jgi:hypothetical protein
MGSCCTLRNDCDLMDNNREAHLGLRKDSTQSLSSMETHLKNKKNKNYRPDEIDVRV